MWLHSLSATKNVPFMTSMRYLHVFMFWVGWCHIIISLCCEAARKDGSPLHRTDLSSPQWTNISLFTESTLHLLSLQLSSANLTGSFPREIGEFSLLQNVFLNVNSFSGSIPLELGYASSLSEIDLSRDNISALDFGGFPEFITKLKGLYELDLSSNMFESIVLERLTLLKLEKLNLSDNNFTGVLPSFGSSRLRTTAVAGLVIGQVMEKASYGTVYKAKLNDGGTTIALRLLREESKPGKLVLNWARRHKIALGIARDWLIFTPDKKFL
ncbi:unnamed protein product [Arabidopsis lyrata]|nr:unnamed protein product [Arabidopsis lyrata]